jgi:hypothetical protein
MNFSPSRFAFGVAVLAILAILDFREKGKDATRWREYAFLLLCTAVAILYGIANDQVTCSISWEYFYYGKELAPILGPQTPPDPVALHLQALRIGVAATWWAGLIIGAAILITNNRARVGPQLPYSRLIARLPAVVFITIASALIVGYAGDHYLLNDISPDFQNLANSDLWRPHRFMTVYGIHLGGYVGGVLSILHCISSIRRERHKLARAAEQIL